MKKILVCGLFALLVACADDSSSPPPPTPTPIPMVCCSGTLTWENNKESDLAGYRVYRSVTAVIPNDETRKVFFLASVTQPTFHDTTGIEMTTYYYIVTAYDTADNESQNSNEVNITY
jgi:fibronectin type 3 domain-containing protein